MVNRIRVAFALSTGLVLALLATPSRAVNLSFTGTLSFQLYLRPPLSVSGSGFAEVNGSGPSGHLTGLALPGSVFSAMGMALPINTGGTFTGGIQVTVHNGAGVFAGDGGAGFGGAMPLQGFFKVCAFGPCSAAVNNIVVPLSVAGQGGVATLPGGVNVTTIGAPWTTGTTAIATQFGTWTAMGGVSPLSNTGAPSGKVTLVTPIFVSTSLGTPDRLFPLFGILTLHFVPEPATLALLGAGIAGLAAASRHARTRTPRS